MNIFNNENKTRKTLLIVAFGVILYCFLQNLAGVKVVLDKMIDILFPFIIGAIIAFIVNIPMKKLEEKVFTTQHKIKGKVLKKEDTEKKVNKPKRIVSLILSYLFVILIISLVIKIIIPQLINICVMFVQDIPDAALNIKKWALDITEQYPNLSAQIQQTDIKWDEVTKEIVTSLTNILKSLVSSSINVITSVIGGILNAIVAIIFSVYILLSKESLKNQAQKFVMAYFKKDVANYIFKISQLSEKAFSNFISGQFLEAIILGILCFIGTLILGTPYGSTISILVGVTALVPIVGAIVGGLISTVLILSVSPAKAVAFLIFLIILQQLETNIIYPRVVGSSVGLPGIWVLLAVAIGGKLFGMIGFLIGLPFVSVAYTILRENVNKRLKNIEVV